MLKNHFKIALRNLVRYKAYSLINIAGLSVGIGTTLLIMMFIRFEYSFDNFHEHADSIYRVSIVSKHEGQVEYDSPVFVPPMGPTMAEEFPEVESQTRIATPRTVYFYRDNEAVKVTSLMYADSSFFEIFSFQLIRGNPELILKDPYSIVLTEKTAERIFGNQDPIGKVLKSDRGDLYTVSGIVKEPPLNSHLRFNALASFSSLYLDPTRYMGWNGGNQYTAYVTLRPGISQEVVEAKFPDFMWKHINESLANLEIEYQPYLQPLKSLHLQYGDYTGANMGTIYIFCAIAVLVLVVACINFVNLTMAQASRRTLEVGVRKVLGANRLSLVRQFIAESIILCFVALLLSMILVELVFPFFQQVLGREFERASVISMGSILGAAAIVAFVGIAAGAYPAFYISSLQAAKTLKQSFTGAKHKMTLRNVLVVFQFSISITLIICTFIINNQLVFIQNKDLGYNKDSLLAIPLLDNKVKLNAGVLKNKLLETHNVIGVTATSEVPVSGFTSNGYIPEGLNSPLMIHVVDVDENFLETYGIQLVSGRNFSTEFGLDKHAYLINEKLASHLGWDEPLGKTIFRNEDHTVIGVVKDFHYSSLYHTIEPLIITNQPWNDRFSYLTVRFKSGEAAQVLDSIRETWEKVVPAVPFEYWFLSEGFEYLYNDEERFRVTILYFSGIALLIALFGLYSLAAYTAENRTKEIGVRKVLGATVVSIIQLLSKEYIILVAVANLIAWPVAYYVMNRWLQSFAYRTDLELWTFLLAGVLALVIALVTVSVKGLKAATLDPVRSLRYE